MTAGKPPAKNSTCAAIILAAGSSRRFGAENKLLVAIDGVPLIRRVAGRLLDSRAAMVIVVTGYQQEAIKQALSGLNIRFVHNARHLEGMGTTVAAGVAALDEAIEYAIITPGDLPGLPTPLIDRLLTIAQISGGDRIVFPTLPTGEQRNPVVWPRRFFAELAALSGDTGARRVIKAHAASAMPVPMDAAETFLDIDRPEDLDAWRRLDRKKGDAGDS